MRLIEVQRQIKKRRFQEFLKIKITEDNKLVAKAIFKQWAGKQSWEPLSITVENPKLKVTLREMMYNAASNAGFFIKDQL